MQKGILAGRMDMARQRIVTAVLTAVANGLADPELGEALQVAQSEKRDEVRALLELEAIAPIIESLAEERTSTVAVDVDSILAIEGLSITSQKAIKAHYASSD